MLDINKLSLSRRRFLKQGATATAMFSGAGITSFQLLHKSEFAPESIVLNSSSARAIQKLHEIEVKELVEKQQASKTNSSIIQSSVDPVDSINLDKSLSSVDKTMPELATLQVAPEIKPEGNPVVIQPETIVESEPVVSTNVDNASEVWRQRVVRFDENLPGDIQLPEDQMPLLHSVSKKLARIQRFVGFGNFNLLSFDRMLYLARNNDEIGDFTKQELDFLDFVFFRDASDLGFMGEKVVTNPTVSVKDNDVTKISGSGHFLFRGVSEVHFKKLQDVLGNDLVLTSGIRGIVKQHHLYLAKAIKTNGNMSRASRSLAPPGYSYHALGDFDVGQKGLGFSNFTSAFAESDVFKRLTDLGFIKIRYTQDNKFGVRFEPWHIRVV